MEIFFSSTKLDNDAAVIMMVDSNLQRENILPSERAKAYKMKLEALKHQGQRHDLTSTQVVEKLAAEQVGDDAGISRESVRQPRQFRGMVAAVAGDDLIPAVRVRAHDEGIGNASALFLRPQTGT